MKKRMSVRCRLFAASMSVLMMTMTSVMADAELSEQLDIDIGFSGGTVGVFAEVLRGDFESVTVLASEQSAQVRLPEMIFRKPCFREIGEIVMVVTEGEVRCSYPEPDTLVFTSGKNTQPDSGLFMHSIESLMNVHSIEDISSLLDAMYRTAGVEMPELGVHANTSILMAKVTPAQRDILEQSMTILAKSIKRESVAEKQKELDAAKGQLKELEQAKISMSMALTQVGKEQAHNANEMEKLQDRLSDEQANRSDYQLAFDRLQQRNEMLTEQLAEVKKQLGLERQKKTN